MYTDDQLVPISALKHLFFYPRQCALLHVERVWSENMHTAKGQHMHVCISSRVGRSRLIRAAWLETAFGGDKCELDDDMSFRCSLNLKICRSLEFFWVGFDAGGNGAKVELCGVLLGFLRGID